MPAKRSAAKGIQDAPGQHLLSAEAVRAAVRSDMFVISNSDVNWIMPLVRDPRWYCERRLMPLYDLRLFKTASDPPAHKLMDRILFKANDDEQAIATAPFLDAAMFDESELGLLFDKDQKRLWILKP